MSDPNNGAVQFFSDDHRACDDLWGELEGAAGKGDAGRAAELWAAFDKAMRRHFDMEEQVLFPAIEEVTGMRDMGPTAVMRSEHRQMRAVLEQMAAEMARGDLQGLLDHGDTLLMLTQQHNVKEEGVLYPLAERALGPQWSGVAAELEGMLGKGA